MTMASNTADKKGGDEKKNKPLRWGILGRSLLLLEHCQERQC